MAAWRVSRAGRAHAGAHARQRAERPAPAKRARRCWARGACRTPQQAAGRCEGSRWLAAARKHAGAHRARRCGLLWEQAAQRHVLEPHVVHVAHVAGGGRLHRLAAHCNAEAKGWARNARPPVSACTGGGGGGAGAQAGPAGHLPGALSSRLLALTVQAGRAGGGAPQAGGLAGPGAGRQPAGRSGRLHVSCVLWRPVRDNAPGQRGEAGWGARRGAGWALAGGRRQRTRAARGRGGRSRGPISPKLEAPARVAVVNAPAAIGALIAFRAAWQRSPITQIPFATKAARLRHPARGHSRLPRHEGLSAAAAHDSVRGGLCRHPWPGAAPRLARLGAGCGDPVSPRPLWPCKLFCSALHRVRIEPSSCPAPQQVPGPGGRCGAGAADRGGRPPAGRNVRHGVAPGVWSSCLPAQNVVALQPTAAAAAATEPSCGMLAPRRALSPRLPPPPPPLPAPTLLAPKTTLGRSCAKCWMQRSSAATCTWTRSGARRRSGCAAGTRAHARPRQAQGSRPAGAACMAPTLDKVVQRCASARRSAWSWAGTCKS